MPSTCHDVYRWHALGHGSCPFTRTQRAHISIAEDLETRRSGTSRGYEYCSQWGRSHQVTAREHGDKQGGYVSRLLAMESRRKVTSLATELRRRVMSVQWKHQHQAGRTCQQTTSNGIKAEGHVTSNKIKESLVSTVEAPAPSREDMSADY